MGRILTNPTPWEIDHAAGIIRGFEYQQAHGSLPDTPMWRMLERRHDLAAARFDRYHPNVGRILEGACVAEPPACVTPHHWIGRMRGSTEIPTCPPGPPPIPAVPEPSSLLLGALVVLAGAIAWLGEEYNK
jgi:hypothetical protein